MDKIQSRIDAWSNQFKEEEENASIFIEEPAPLDDLLYSEDYLNIKKLSDIQYDFIKHGTQVYKDEELDKLGWEKQRRVGELIAKWGKGGGKDMCSALTFTIVAHYLLCLRNPQKYYGQANTTSIDMLNMAYNSAQAKDVFFKYLSSMIQSCKWFNNKATIQVEKIEFDKNIWAYSGNSFEEAFEGKNLILCVLDEISAFKTKQEVEHLSIKRMRAPRYSAESVYDMAKSSVESRFSGGIGKVISLSFPRFKNDYICQLYETGKKFASTYVSFGATWDVNPNKKRSDFDDEFLKNPERAEGRYACNPVGIEGGYFRNKDKLIAAFPLVSEDRIPTVNDRTPYLKPELKCLHNYLCSIHIDLGLTNDHAGIAMSHVCGSVKEVKSNELGEKTTIDKPVVELDLATSFIAPMNGEIQFAHIRAFILDLVNKEFKIGKITLDNFQSADFLQIMASMGILTEKRSVDRTTEAYDCLKELVYDGRMKGYSYLRQIESGIGTIEKNEILEEMFNLILVAGRKVDHSAIGSKDLSDAIAGSVQGALELGLCNFTTNDIEMGGDREAQTYSSGTDGNDYSEESIHEENEIAFFT